MLYFLSLRGFDPRYGVIAEPHNKYPFLLSDTGVFEPDEQNPEYLSSGLERAVDVDGFVYYISEPNIQKLLREQRSGSGNILIDHVRTVDTELLAQILDPFYEGYRSAENQLFHELGEGYLTLPLIQRERQLLNFLQYTHGMLYFEGFAIPNLLYALGYLQSILVAALKEYQITQQLIEASHENQAVPVVKNEPSHAYSKQALNDTSKNELAKVLLSCPFTDVLQLWSILTDQHLCDALNIPVAFINEEIVKELLGSMFETADSGALPTMPHQYWQLSPAYMNLLCLLMHATYKINHNYIRLPLRPYCQLLKSTFSPFESIEAVQDIVSNISKKADAVLPALMQSPGEKTKNALLILKKIGVYRISS